MKLENDNRKMDPGFPFGNLPRPTQNAAGPLMKRSAFSAQNDGSRIARARLLRHEMDIADCRPGAERR